MTDLIVLFAQGGDEAALRALKLHPALLAHLNTSSPYLDASVRDNIFAALTRIAESTLVSAPAEVLNILVDAVLDGQ